MQALADLLITLQPGQQVTVNLVHTDGSRATVTVTLGQLA
jgi:hypothetical protein